MSPTFILLQVINTLFALATVWIHFKNPFLLDDQGIVISTLAGMISISLTAILLGFSFIFSENNKLVPSLINLLLTLGFAAVQGYSLFLLGIDLGIIQMLKSKLGF